MQILKSELDQSVNFVEKHLEGFLESRYVRRSPDYFVCYLSSHNGCNKGCKFCHLTATKQTSFEDSTKGDFIKQAEEVFKHYRTENIAKSVHFSFMARGEVLANKQILQNGDEILFDLGKMATRENLYSKFCLSTIIPKNVKPLTDIFRIMTPTIYYSLYSMDENWRNTWIPAALPVKESLDILKDYQKLSKKIIKIHFPFIEGENDSSDNLGDMCNELNKRKLRCEFNLVMYNPFSPEQGQETNEVTMKYRLELLKEYFPGPVKVINRVGFDVKASCGCFV